MDTTEDKRQDERLTIIETTMPFIKASLDKIETKLDKFIGVADTKYASKEEVTELRASVKTAIVTAVVGVIGFLANIVISLWKGTI